MRDMAGMVLGNGLWMRVVCRLFIKECTWNQHYGRERKQTEVGRGRSQIPAKAIAAWTDSPGQLWSQNDP